MGLCPFHNEKTPSFSVSPQKGIFHCFGCGVGGTVINFVMKTDNLTFTEAVKYLAQRANIALPVNNGYDAKKELEIKDRKETLFNINTEAARFFYSHLSTEDGKAAVEYFKKRNISGKVAKSFFLGYSPNQKRSLYDYLLSKGFSESDILNAGLITKNDKNEYFDKFRNRIMFPIFNVNDKIIGFGARRINEDVNPKYLNSPDTLVYNKSKNLYALNIAKKSKKDFVILVEGYMDVISLMKYGFFNVTASLGTSLTTDQAKLMKRYFNEVVICYDSDEAGQAAAKRAISILRDADVKVSVMRVTGAKDTDEFINKYGADRFNLIVSQKKSDIAYLMQIFGEKYNLKNNEEKVLYVNELIPYLQKVTNNIELDVFVSEISKITSITPQAIYLQLGKTKRVQTDFKIPETLGFMNSKKSDRLLKSQEALLSLIAADANALAKNEDIIKEDLFEKNLYKQIFKQIKENFPKKIDASLLATDFDDDDVSEITKILSLDLKCEDTVSAARDYASAIKEELKRREVEKLLKAGNIDAINEIFKNEK